MLILFQAGMALLFFMWAVLLVRESQLPQEAAFVTWSVRFRLLCAFLIGVFFTVFCVRNVRKLFSKKSPEESA